MSRIQSRRRFLTILAAAGAGGALGAPPAPAAEGPLETPSLRLTRTPTVCLAPQFVAEDLLRAEGFTDISYVDTVTGTDSAKTLGSGKADLSFDVGSAFITAIDSGEPVTVLAGAMAGCIELFANQRVQSIADLKGKRAGARSLGTSAHILLSIMAAYVGLDPVRDIDWVIDPEAKPVELFASGKVDVYITNPPESLDLRAQRIGHVIVSTSVDQPWSQYFCCMLAGNRDYVRHNPIATKRALRAILKASDICAADPARAARYVVDGGFLPRYDYALQTLTENAYDRWRQFDAEDTIRFYALRMHEAGFIKASPQKIIANGTDWRFLNELKRELKI